MSITVKGKRIEGWAAAVVMAGPPEQLQRAIVVLEETIGGLNSKVLLPAPKLR
jgi:hypothetical protein